MQQNFGIYFLIERLRLCKCEVPEYFKKTYNWHRLTVATRIFRAYNI